MCWYSLWKSFFPFIKQSYLTLFKMLRREKLCGGFGSFKIFQILIHLNVQTDQIMIPNVVLSIVNNNYVDNVLV
jgi:hypothetical protein